MFKKSASIAAFLTALVCLLLYLPSLQHGFVSIDDPDYVLNNPLIRQLNRETVITAFTGSHLGWWMPLTWISLAIDYQFWGLDPYGYHLTNIVLHAVNSGLVVLIADRVIRGTRELTSWERVADPGYYYLAVLLAAGLFFGVHPLRVESVAWVTERKDVLNGLFAFLAILFYLHYAVRKEMVPDGGHAGVFYALSLFCFSCSLMAKSVSVVLPAVFVILDWVPLGRMPGRQLRHLIVEKWPFWAASAIMAVCTILFAAQSQYLVTYEAFPLGQRIVVSGNAILEYVRLLLLPLGLSPFNVIPDPIPTSYVSKTVLVIIVIAWIMFAGKARRLTAATLCFLLPLLPVLAFFQNGDQSYADRFTYLPSLSPSLFLALELYHGRRFREDLRVRCLAIALAAGVTAMLMVGTSRQLQVWRSTEALWNRIIEVEPLAISYKERGRHYHAVGRYAEAVADFTAALERVTPTLQPYAYNLYAFRAESLRAAGRLEESVRDFSTAIGQLPHPAYYYHRGLALRAMGRTVEADEDFRRSGPDPGPIVWFD